VTMTPIETQMEELKGVWPAANATRAASGAHLVEVPGYPLPEGWNSRSVRILFVAPPGYPGAQPDCFWLESENRSPVRLAEGKTPHATNDSNPIPEFGPRGTWFSWHLQAWNPNRDSLLTYVHVIEKRLWPAR
jgi:hypothetical protein